MLNPLQNDAVFHLILLITKWMDKRYLDPILGFFFPGIGDTVTSLLVLPYLYLSLVKLRSLPLTLAVLVNTLVDVLLGMLPYFVGDIFDFFHRSYQKNYRLIEGYARGDSATFSAVLRRAVLSAVLVCFLLLLIFLCFYFLWSLLSWGYTWIFG